MKLSRRAMIKDGFLAVSAGMIMPSIFSRGIASARAQSIDGSRIAQASGGRTLIVIQMAGGNDGLSTVIPIGDPLYHQVRPTLAILDAEVLPLDTRLGLHPNLAPLKQLWDGGHMAIIEGVGYPNQSLSHFQAMDIWQTLDLSGAGSEGWLGKLVSGWVDQDGHPFKALDIGVQTAQALASISAPVPTLATVNTYRLYPDPADTDNGNARLQALMKLYNSYPKTSPYAALLDTTALSAQDGSQQLHDADAQYQATVTYPTGPFAAGLKILAEAIVEGLGLRVGYVTLGGFDTHANQQATHDTLMKILADGLSAFYTDLSNHGKADTVVIMTWSEFGRRVEENGSLGTDHGTAGPMFLFGKHDRIKGGFYGRPPSLTDLDDGNLKMTTDFRSVYATAIQEWLGYDDAATILRGRFDTLSAFV